jgi:hypothetical protein
MALITIEDLPKSEDLDREAMRSIVGGGRIEPRPLQAKRVQLGGVRVIEYPPGFGHREPSPSPATPGRFPG